MNEISYVLSHKRLDNISEEKFERLLKDETLEHLTFDDANVCIVCVKGKFTKSRKKLQNETKKNSRNHSFRWLRPLPTLTFNCHRYFRTFKYDFSCFAFIYLIFF